MRPDLAVFEQHARSALPRFFTPLEVFGSLPTTMARAAELADAGAPEGATVLAEEQTAGRGRLDRRWAAPPGSSLLLSLVLRPPLPRAEVWLAAVAAGVALADAVGELLPGVPVGLKWPNDLLVAGGKAAGLLAEARGRAAAPAGGQTAAGRPPDPAAGRPPDPAAGRPPDPAAGERPDSVVLGMGVNVTQGRADFPAQVAGRATSLALAAAAVGLPPADRIELLGRWGERFVATYRLLGAGRGDAVLAAYRARLDTLGRRVRADRLHGGPLSGVAVDLAEGGALVIRVDSGELVTVAAADVEHLRPGHPDDPAAPA
jgi:BirA family biotin operon repressor/biotin-[acetyl-CoA-carboxylase] ligase